MPEPRLATGIWVSAYLARLGLANIPAYVIARGDETAGAVLVKCARLDGTAVLYGREWDFDSDTRPWQVLAQGDEREVDQAVVRQRGFDPDLWVVEIESRDGRTLLDEPGLA
ncbi:hypothetical protein PARHAE_00425 [Paracoccus haematequi]|uniref:GTP-binding protein Era n=1 Tax=Paracoccus haematequi TaxID=2491866 RepID=A0A3S4CGH2_9RHOB|nr:DUF1491 family protein [Paracoccus haematequi]VDS07250.1 hypothetical protein PARHAE_00425 [Paracoccus haematequi]